MARMVKITFFSYDAYGFSQLRRWADNFLIARENLLIRSMIGLPFQLDISHKLTPQMTFSIDHPFICC